MGVGATFDLSGQVALVTGASRGLGKAMAIALAEVGARVVMVARNQVTLEQSAKEIESKGGKTLTAVCDVTKEDQVAAMVAKAIAECGKIDILVNNAGIAWQRPFLEMSSVEFRDAFDVNVNGMFLVSQAVGRHMVERRRGKVINIGSLHSVVGAPNMVHYCSSKGAVVQFTRALAAEWAKCEIQVNCLCPGYFLTEINMSEFENEKLRNKVLSGIPARRFAKPEELGPTVVYLASSATDYMTGQVMVVDGGFSIR